MGVGDDGLDRELDLHIAVALLGGREVRELGVAREALGEGPQALIVLGLVRGIAADERLEGVEEELIALGELGADLHGALKYLPGL